MKYKIKKNINKYIFRGYDVRGIYKEELDEDSAYTFGKGYGTHLRKMNITKMILGCDNRISGPYLKEALVEGILSTGVDIIDIGISTTPMFYFAQIYLNTYAGIEITASHNPKDDNGFKFSYDIKGNCKGQEILDLRKEIEENNFYEGEGKLFTKDVKRPYLELIKKSINLGDKKLKVVIDPGNGTTSTIVKEVFSMFNLDTTFINDISDGNFPNHHPDPCVESNLEQLKNKVKEINADIGVAYDGDGDRLGCITPKGIFIPTDKYMILIIRDIINKVSNKKFLYDVKCSKALSDEITRLGGIPYCYKTGNSYTKARVKELDLAFGGELSGHVYFRDRWPGFDSGIYASLRLIEILSKSDKTLDEMIEDIPKYYQTEEEKIECSDETKFKVVDLVKEYVKEQNYNYIDLDGVRVEFSDGWALVRASNTGPNLTLRFEATTNEKLLKYKNEFYKVVNKIKEII